LKILIASDLHGNLPGARFIVSKALKEGCDLVALLGDLIHCGLRSDTFDGLLAAKILSSLTIPVVSVRGNCDSDSDLAEFPWFTPESAWLFLDQLFLLCHGHQMRQIEQSFEGFFNLISGHTHVPMADNGPRGRRWNPGSLGLPEWNYPPSYGLYHDGVFRVMSLTDEVICEDRLN
jgi:putative phosphoesterase